MNDWIKFLEAFPASWFIFGVFVAWLFFFKLAAVYKEQIATLREEREDYKQKLHAEKGSHQATLLENESLRMRPDLTTIEKLLDRQADTMEKMGESLDQHIKDDAKIFTSIESAMKQIPEAMAKMSDGFDKRQAAVMKRLKIKP